MKITRTHIKKTGLALLFILVAIQFIRIDKTAPPVVPGEDFMAVTNPSNEVRQILTTACYDCHSYETKYPWYSQIAPVSWWLKNHVNEGREELNFSVWKGYKSRRQDKKLKECAELIEEGEMPLYSYTITHRSARLNNEQKAVLIRFFNSLRTRESDRPKED